MESLLYVSYMYSKTDIDVTPNAGYGMINTVKITTTE